MSSPQPSEPTSPVNRRPFRLRTVLLLSGLLGAALGIAKVWAVNVGMDATFWGIFIVGGMIWLAAAYAAAAYHRWQFGTWVLFLVGLVYCACIVLVKATGEGGFACVAIGLVMVWAGAIAAMVVGGAVE
ncbi:MAG: hypothetical protein N2C14_26165 [Planctomycetales bacterium]